MVAHSVVEDAGLLEAIDTSSTLDLHRSNLLRMQITELLEECQMDLESRKWTVETQEYFKLLSKIISNVEVLEKDFRELADKSVSVELHPTNELSLSMEPIGCTKTRLGWTKKSGNAQVLPTFDFMVQIPSAVFAAKDFMHFRYFDKRKIILNKIAETLSERSAELGIVELLWMNGSNRPPILRLEPPGKRKGPTFQVHLHLGMESIDWIPKLRLVPNRSNIKDNGAKSQFYNFCLLHDARHKFEDFHMEDLTGHKSCQDALILLQVWALQRGLWRNHDGWDKSAVSLLIVYLLRTNKINPRMTPIQLFTVVLQTWATTNWLGQKEHVEQKRHVAQGHDIQTNLDQRRQRAVLVLPRSGETETQTIRTAELSELYEKQTEESPLTSDDPRTLLDAYSWTDRYFLGPVFLDPSMNYNYLGGVSPNYMKFLSWHSQKSLEDLKKSRSAFEVLFMQRARFWQQWDLYFRAPAACAGSSEDWEFSVRQLLKTLEWGLGNRIHAMRILSTGNGDFSLDIQDTDQFPKGQVHQKKQSKKDRLRSPTGTDDIIIGVSINAETSQRLVDRGPPSDHHEDVKHFMDLWGSKAQLRRFKDGAIVQAVVWSDDKETWFQNREKWNGGYVEKVIRHLIRLHHGTMKTAVCFPSFLSTIDCIVSDDSGMVPSLDPWATHQRIMKAFESLSDFLQKNSRQPQSGQRQDSSLGLPLSIDAVEPLSPSLRYSELFPQVPHPLLGRGTSAEKKCSGAVMFDPILIQIRFGPSSKWPTDLKAIGAAKTAMLIQLANGIEKIGDESFDGLLTVCPTYADIGYKGYCFRVIIRADPEIQMLQRLITPSPAASQLLRQLTKRHLLASRHHSMIHAVHTLYPSAAAVVRVAKRWVACHLLSGHITTELIELLVARIYSDSSAFVQPPATVVAGFLRFLHLISSFDWAREPLVVNPRGHISDEEYDDINRAFEKCRSKGKDSGPPIYVIAPYNRCSYDLDQEEDQNNNHGVNSEKWQQSVASPEWVVLRRLVHLAKRSHEYMYRCLSNFDDSDWSAIFHETPNSFKSYSVLMRVNAELIVDQETSSTSGSLEVIKNEDGTEQSSFTRSMKSLSIGPRTLRQNVYRNVRARKAGDIVPGWNPIQMLVASLQAHFGEYAVFFYNEFCPQVIGIVWRPEVFTPTPFSALSSESSYPVNDNWTGDTLVSRNSSDLLRELTQYTKDMVTNIRVFDDTSLAHFSKRQKVAHDVEGLENVSSVSP